MSVSSQEQYMVETITNKRFKNGRVEYEIKWQGYSENEKTWKPIENQLSVMIYMLDFEQQLIVIGSYDDGDLADEIIQQKQIMMVIPSQLEIKEQQSTKSIVDQLKFSQNAQPRYSN
ncbi:unnamed protein product [Paramecium primaurelia]|uniref:Chromo domain-containing protein n=1 Tax=Paramecium primaurelia TaxID=5886 RepID=A0A8S1QF60_PARPR|nr:unnamed protein product [Paramecium primaurelia]